MGEQTTVHEDSLPQEPKTIYRLGNCEVCATEPAKYTCPQCELKTCCLKCINIHKKELECDGIRNKVKFIPMKKFSDLDLQNDFNLLEEVSKSLFKYKKDPVKNSVLIYNHLPFALHILRKFAYMRKTQLKFLPKLFTKHKVNTSYACRNKLYWRIEWVFVSANIKEVNEKLIDSTRLSTALIKHLDKPELAHYKSMGVNGLTILLKVERSSKFYLLDSSVSIAENLRNKCIIEFPIFHVLFHYEKDMFEIDDEDSRNPKAETCIKSEQEESSNCPNQTEQDVSDSLSVGNENMCMFSEDISEIIAEPVVKDDSDYSSICYEYDY